MKPLIQLKKATPLFHVVLALGCLALLPRVQAVSPAPDGGYPGFNTAEGQKALFGLTTGVANTAVGWFSLFSNTDGSYNTGVGAGTLLFNVGDQATPPAPLTRPMDGSRSLTIMEILQTAALTRPLVPVRFLAIQPAIQARPSV